MIKLDQPLLVNNVASLLKLITRQIAASTTLEIDLSAVTNIDSAGMAFLIELKAIAIAKKCQLAFNDIPDAVNKFCKLYQVTL